MRLKPLQGDAHPLLIDLPLHPNLQVVQALHSRQRGQTMDHLAIVEPQVVQIHGKRESQGG